MNKFRKIGHVGLLNIFLIYNIEELWTCLAMSDQAQLISYSDTKNQFLSSTHSHELDWNFGNPAI